MDHHVFFIVSPQLKKIEIKLNEQCIHRPKQVKTKKLHFPKP